MAKDRNIGVGFINKKSTLSRSIKLFWWIQGDSNPRPPRCERGALPTEL